jgi:two-component system cell cycle sensor histidine kinase/response regulator CckA
MSWCGALPFGGRVHGNVQGPYLGGCVPNQGAGIALPPSEELFRTLADNISQLAWMADPTGSIFWFNRRWYEFTGTTLDEMQGWGWTKVHHPDHVDRVVERIRHSWETGEAWEDTFPLRGRDGQFRSFLSRALPIRDEQGSVACWFGTNTDITAQLEAEAERERLLASERTARHRAEAILETALDGIITIDNEGRIRDFNPAAERMFGRSRADAVGQEVAELIIPPRFRDSHRRGFAHFLATGKGQVLNTRTDLTALRADGTEFPVEVGVTRISPSHPSLITGYIRDVTEIRRNEKRRAVRYAVTNALANADGIPDATSAILRAVCETLGWQVGELWLVDREAGLLRLLEAWSMPLDGGNEFMEASRTWTFPQGVGLPGNVWTTGEPIWLPDLAAATSFPRVELAARAGLHAILAVPIRLGREVLGVMQFISSTIESPDGPLLDLLAIAGNQIGQFIGRKRAEEERAELLVREQAALADAEAAIRMRDQLVASVSHDLKNPLTAISGQVQVLQFLAARGREELPPERLLGSLDAISSTAKRMTTLINELLDAVHLQAGLQIELRRRPTDLANLALQVVTNHQHATENHSLRFDGNQPGPIGDWDPERLERVLDNIVSNAIKYTPNGGDIVVQVVRDRGWAVLSVQDHGVGIPTADLPHVFERYRRARNVSAKFAGSGLGLAGAKDLIELHGGSISVTSVEGVGSRFVVRLPLKRRKRRERPAVSTETAAANVT